MNEQTVFNIDVNERGLAYGDGHFTTAKIIDGNIEHLNLHIARLVHAHDVLGLATSVAEIDTERLIDYLSRVAKDFDKAVVKVMITAGAGGRGYARNGLKQLNIFVLISSFPEHYDLWRSRGIDLGLSPFVLSSSPVLAGIKHLNRIEQVLIRDELERRNEDDVLVCDQYGNVIEASCANLFWFKNGQWHTPELSTSGVDGIYRQFILSRVEHIKVDSYSVAVLEDVDAMFICNSVMGIVSVAKYKGVSLTTTPVTLLGELIK